jgi:hypothetical protein
MLSSVTDSSTPITERRANERRTNERPDRRKRSRGGRRTADPRSNWRRLAWFFAAYAIYLSVRALPASIVKLFKRVRTPTAG